MHKVGFWAARLPSSPGFPVLPSIAFTPPVPCGARLGHGHPPCAPGWSQPSAGCSLYGHPCRVVEQGQARVAHLPSPTHPDRLCRSSLGTASPPWYPPLLPLQPVLGGLLAPTAGWHAVYLLLLGGLSRANAGAALAPARLKRLREVLGCHLLSQLVPPGNSLLQDTGFGKSNPRACRSCTAPHRARAHRESLAEPSRRQSHVSGPLLANTGLQP